MYNLKLNILASVRSKFDVLKAKQSGYLRHSKMKAFSYEKVRDILKNHEKWLCVKKFSEDSLIVYQNEQNHLPPMSAQHLQMHKFHSESTNKRKCFMLSTHHLGDNKEERNDINILTTEGNS